MGCSIYIGNKFNNNVTALLGSRHDEGIVTNGNYSKYESWQIPSYTQFSNWCELMEFEFPFEETEEGDFSFCKIDQDLINTFKQVRLNFEKKHPEVLTKDLKYWNDNSEENKNWIYKIILYYDYWINRAYNECKNPVVAYF